MNKLRQLDREELQEELSDANRRLQRLRAEKSMMKLEDTSQLSKTKKYIAQIKTIINEKERLKNLQGEDTNDSTKEEDE